MHDPVIFRADGGEPLAVCGYFALYNSPSIPMLERGGLREVIAEGAFDGALRRGEVSRVPIRAWHMAHATLATPRDSRIAVWSDGRGVAFQATHIAATPSAARLIQLIAAGELCGCSFQARLHGGVESVRGERMFVVTKVDGFEDITVTHTSGGCYPETACWLGHFPVDDLSPHFRDLAITWARQSTAQFAPKSRSPIFNRAQMPVDVFDGLPVTLAAAMHETGQMMQRAASKIGLK